MTLREWAELPDEDAALAVIPTRVKIIYLAIMIPLWIWMMSARHCTWPETVGLLGILTFLALVFWLALKYGTKD